MNEQYGMWASNTSTKKHAFVDPARIVSPLMGEAAIQEVVDITIEQLEQMYGGKIEEIDAYEI
ncbi:MAG: hypothetical protein LBG88_01040 [Christensenellaceae bacterium]|jgi:hypothetical protein|nr:hypothetical protein [Christensenellaceae bacterium]